MFKKLFKIFEYQKIQTTYNDQHVFDEFDTQLLKLHENALRIIRNKKNGEPINLRAEEQRLFAKQA